MTQAVLDLFEKASELPETDRAELAGLLLQSIEYELEPGIEEAWAAEIERRMADYCAGTVKTIPWSEVRAQLHRPNRAIKE
jgi:putative addiction module component (TIGR02574 family)